jgi:hypothetical protein
MEIARAYGPIARIWFGPVQVVLLTDADCIERVVKSDKLSSRRYLLKKPLEQLLRNGRL